MSNINRGFAEAKNQIEEGVDFELFCLHDESRADVYINGYIYEMTESEFDALCELSDSNESYGQSVKHLTNEQKELRRRTKTNG